MTDDPQLAALLEARANFLREQGASARSGEAGRRGLVLDCGEVRVAVPVESLYGVIAQPRWIPLPGGDPAVLGIVPYRSLYFDVFCGARLLGWPAAGAPSHLVLCRSGGRIFALHLGRPDEFLTWEAASAVAQEGWPAALRECIDARTFVLNLAELLRHPAFSLSSTPST